jgi:AraC-like DNA-binding protein
MAESLGSTDQQHVDGFDEWMDALSEAFVPLDVKADDVGAFSGSLESQTLGLVQANLVVGKRLVARRTPQMIRQADTGQFKLNMPIRGACLIAQDDREALLGEGDFAVCDTARPYDLKFDDDHTMLVVTIPRELLRVGPGNLRAITARRIPAGAGLGAVVSPFLRNLFARIARHELAPTLELSDAVLDLLAASLAEQASQLSAIQPETIHRARLLQVQAYIERALGEPDLDPSSVAAAHHLSPRALQKLFQAQGLTVSGWIRDRRLERARKDLLDPRSVHQKIAVIASRWNLGPPTYFSRVFKEAYGSTPSEYRARDEALRSR